MPEGFAMSPPTHEESRGGPNPMETHVKVIGILDIVFGCIAALGAIFLLLAFGVGSAATGATTKSTWLPGFLAGFGLVLGLLLGALAALFILAGINLVGRRRSGKVLGIIAACFQLFSFPIGTALGIYALVILNNKDTERLLVA